ncbi:hypothetical protein [Geoalkalibacter halelectricus]|uniref:Uncharacterized protein n=1 Tax=Geoalkalibacter halelectricus TaxID=2847045 RepID=A0ABY5ZLI0_9BACT|nr:hypothetical protein [Geoalkalibacter halelectricus]MDO3378772.1 hypothetical protein [Geoalkalibacter halelectricus]UWZ79923.1 hypothetical protein L9S41_00650 [Geoalkalibacter halelectricus]
MKNNLFTTAAAIVLLGLFTPAAGLASTCIDFKGESSTNSLSGVMTLGSAQLQGNRGFRLRCGVQGVLQGFNEQDGSLYFRHTVACDDHTLFILDSHTHIKVDGDCQDQGLSGITGSFTEKSTMVGVDGPYTGWTGTARMTGKIDCEWNRMQISGKICAP